MSKLLINEPPLQVLPTLAAAIGLNDAIVLQQIHYWTGNPKLGKVHNGRRWIYNSVREWQESNFPFWSEATIKRILSNLKDAGLILAENLNERPYDRTLWYTIDYEQLGKIKIPIRSDCTNGEGQVDLMEWITMTQPIPENTQREAKRKNSSTKSEVILR